MRFVIVQQKRRDLLVDFGIRVTCPVELWTAQHDVLLFVQVHDRITTFVGYNP